MRLNASEKRCPGTGLLILNFLLLLFYILCLARARGFPVPHAVLFGIGMLNDTGIPSYGAISGGMKPW